MYIPAKADYIMDSLAESIIAEEDAKIIKMLQDLTKEYVSTRAYYLWDEAGRPESDGVDFWLQAEKEWLSIPTVSSDDFFKSEDCSISVSKKYEVPSL